MITLVLNKINIKDVIYNLYILHIIQQQGILDNDRKIDLVTQKDEDYKKKVKKKIIMKNIKSIYIYKE